MMTPTVSEALYALAGLIIAWIVKRMNLPLPQGKSPAQPQPLVAPPESFGWRPDWFSFLRLLLGEVMKQTANEPKKREAIKAQLIAEIQNADPA
jgi:hypothetical protein